LPKFRLLNQSILPQNKRVITSLSSSSDFFSIYLLFIYSDPTTTSIGPKLEHEGLMRAPASLASENAEAFWKYPSAAALIPQAPQHPVSGELQKLFTLHPRELLNLG